ncbi:MAG TPA: hypothetical protein VHC86_16065 [Opitutaceae bacterium]|nr:hypothetical protein [Opitutaceae bacterium]
MRRLADRPFLLGFGLAALAAAAAALVMRGLFPHFAGWTGSASFSRIAENLARSGLYSSDGRGPTLERMPLYPAILALAIRAGGAPWRALALALNAAAFAAAAGLATRLAARLHRSAAATWACALLLAGHVAWAAEALSFRESAWFALALAGLASALASERVGFGALLGAGLAAGAGYLLRPTGFLLVAALPAWIWAARRALPASWLLCAGLALAAAAACIAPWQLYAIRNFGGPVLEDLEGGNTALKGALPAYWALTPKVDYDLLDAWLVAREARTRPGESILQRDRAWRADTLRAIAASPLNWAAKGLCKVALLFSPVSVPLGYGELEPAGESVRVAHFQLDPWAFASVPAATLILAGALVRARRWRAAGAAERSLLAGLALLVAGLVLVHGATLSETRYRLPFDPLFAILAAPVVGGWAGRLLSSSHED